MKILILTSDAQERVTIQRVIEKGKHQPFIIETSEQAWRAVEMGQTQFIIADWDTSDMRPLQFIPRVRAIKTNAQIYILLITSKSTDAEMVSAGADDYMHRPFTDTEFKSHLTMAERILSLTSNLAMARDQLEHNAIYDELTGLLNRAAFHKQATAELERARRSAAPFSMISVDVDNIKAIYEQYGQEAAESVMRIVAQVIREKSRPYDCLSRWGGNNFLLTVSGTVGVDAEKIANRILRGVHSMKISMNSGEPIDVRISAGVAALATITASTELEPLILKTRQAVARAKEDGGNQVFMVYE